MTDLLNALYRDDDERVSQLLAEGPTLNVFRSEEHTSELQSHA